MFSNIELPLAYNIMTLEHVLARLRQEIAKKRWKKSQIPQIRTFLGGVTGTCLLIKWLRFSLKYEKNDFLQKLIISWKISKFLWSDWKQYRNSLRPFLVIFQTTFEKSWKIILKIYFFDKMTKNTFFSIISIRFPMDTYPGLFLCSSLSVSEIIGVAPVNNPPP